jgi:hypothetical protein
MKIFWVLSLYALAAILSVGGGSSSAQTPGDSSSPTVSVVKLEKTISGRTPGTRIMPEDAVATRPSHERLPEQNAKETDPQTEDRCEAVLHQSVGRPLGLRSRQSRLGDRWQRWAQLPDGIAVLERDRARRFTRVAQGESDLLGTLTRTHLIGGETDLPRLKEIQQSYKLQPLSKFLAVFQFFY